VEQLKQKLMIRQQSDDKIIVLADHTQKRADIVDQILHIDQINSADSSAAVSESKKISISKKNSDNVFDFSEIIMIDQQDK
jgi:hypothetical protein